MNPRAPTLFVLICLMLGLAVEQPLQAQDREQPKTTEVDIDAQLEAASKTLEARRKAMATGTSVGLGVNTESPTAPADPVARRVSEFKDRTQRIGQGEAARAKEVLARSNNRRQEISTLRSQLYAALSMPPASTERLEQIDQTYASLRNLVDRLIDDRLQAIAVLEVARSDHQAAEMETANMGAASDAQLDAALAEFISAHQDRVSGVLAEIDTASAQIVTARTLRREAQDNASATALATLEGQQLVNIQSELQAIPIDIQSAIRRTTKTWWQTPSELKQIQALGSLFLGLTKLAILLVIGMWAHARLPLWMRRLLKANDHHEESTWEHRADLPSWIVPGDVSALAAPLGRFSQDLLVGGVAAFVIAWAGSSVPLLAWVALVFLCGAGIRLAQGTIELIFITPQENRPALQVTDEHTRASLFWVVQAFGLLLAIHLILQQLLVNILGADSLGNLFTEAIQIVGLIVCMLGLYRWSHLLQARIKAGGTGSSVEAWIVTEGTSVPLRILASLAALFLLSMRTIMAIGHGLIESRAGLAWLGALLARRQLRDNANMARTQLSMETRSAIGKGALRELNLDQPLEEIRTAFSAWRKDPRRGLVAIIGDRGCGKSIVLEKLKASVDGRAIHITAPLGHTQETASLSWLIQATGIEAQANTESVIEALLREPSTMFLLSSMHRLFMRAVGHYSGLDAILDVMQATARHHFWVASFHGPAWSFLAGMDHVGHVGIFQSRVQLAAMNAADLSAWLHKRTKMAGFRPNFESLLQRPTTGPDHHRMLERTERAFWRLMADASQGNPTVAARLWVDCLQPGAADDDVCVDVPRAHDSSELEALSDSELFTLTAIVLHDDISVDELHVVLNQSENRVRATCRGLEQATLITETDTSRYKVRLNWLPAVERHLRRRSFLHKN